MEEFGSGRESEMGEFEGGFSIYPIFRLSGSFLFVWFLLNSLFQFSLSLKFTIELNSPSQLGCLLFIFVLGHYGIQIFLMVSPKLLPFSSSLGRVSISEQQSNSWFEEKNSHWIHHSLHFQLSYFGGVLLLFLLTYLVWQQKWICFLKSHLPINQFCIQFF